MPYLTAFDALECLYPGALLLSVQQVGTAIGRAEQTIRHHLAAGTFEIPLAPASRRRRPLFRKVDVAAFIDGTPPLEIESSASSSLSPITSPKRRRGRPKNTEKTGRLATTANS